MAKLPRILAHATGGGPLDDLYFSVHEDQETIDGFNNMTENEVYTKDASTLREFTGHERALTKLLFDPDHHDLTQVAEFRYGTNA